MIVDNTSASTLNEGPLSLKVFVSNLLAMPNSHVSIERFGGRRRLRFTMVDAETGKAVRKGLELPNDEMAISSLAESIHRHKQALRESLAAVRHACRDERQWRKTVRERLVAVCPHGRIIKRRVARVFELAADLGYEFLIDFLKRRPWLAKPNRAGRRRKREW